MLRGLSFAFCLALIVTQFLVVHSFLLIVLGSHYTHGLYETGSMVGNVRRELGKLPRLFTGGNMGTIFKR